MRKSVETRRLQPEPAPGLFGASAADPPESLHYPSTTGTF